MEVIPTKKEQNLIQQISKEDITKTCYAGGSVISTTDGTLCWVAEDGVTINVGSIHGEVKHTYPGDSTEVIVSAVSKNNKYLAVSYASGLIYIYDLDIPRTQIMIIKTPKVSALTSPVTVSLCFSFSNMFIAMGSNDGYVRVYDLENKYFTHVLVFSHGLVTSLLFDDTNKDNFYVYAASDNIENIRQFNLMTKKSADFFGHLNGVVSMCFDEDYNLVSAGKDKALIYWDMKTKKPSKTVMIPDPLLIKFIGEKYVIASTDGKIYFLKENKICWESGEDQRLLSPNTLLLTSDTLIHVSYDGYFIFYSFSGEVVNYDCFDRDSVIYCLPLTFENKVESSESSSDSKELKAEEEEEEKEKEVPQNSLHATHVLLVNNSNALELRDLVTHTSKMYYGHEATIMCCDFSKDKNRLIVGYYDGYVSVWDVLTMKELYSFESHSGPVTAIAHSMSKNSFATGSNDKFIKVYKYNDTQAKQLDAFAAHSKEIQYLKYSKKDLYLVSCSADKTAKLWVPKQNYALQGILKGHTRAVVSADFSPIEQVVMTSSVDGTIRMWSVKSLSALKTFQGHNGGVQKAIFVNKGVQVLSVGNDGTTRLWTIKSGENVQTLDTNTSRLWDIEGYNKEFIVCGDGGFVSLIRDVSKEVVQERIKTREQEIMLSQKLMNLTRSGKWKEALRICVELGLPKEALNCCYHCDVKEAISDWDATLGQKFYQFARKWNERNVTMAVAQIVMEAIFMKWTLEDILDEQLKKSLQRMKELNTKHLETLDGYYRKALFVKYVADALNPLPDLI
ncbi:hypothetical protein EIN_390790 [Entamoeba invadens IP1]|uniref:U3 small nucleolar RNA-associated protein 13 C-terminal domain-containing protein n=1 Tax=Entamoeba invadens IP1 TaxID=370355 RepID=A0A0A1U588_ENTIV|nr:hypothetical protein EIN_390790 [Entamoeba invadens IP1]ELP89454.1 hypothetical protein EIN_390790 [Entamoeba invadens IP1]|eukprot:XP_004256225.1 hypothetical protein EIN_390790 [Entamoeba invadens IP1]